VALAEAYIAAKNPEAARTEIQTILTREPSNAAAIALREEIEVLH
jgi:Tfp pilus assembly protein PilF